MGRAALYFMPNSRHSTIEAHRATIAHFEAETKLGRDDPVLTELKRIILNRIADLEGLCPPEETISAGASGGHSA